MAQDACGCSGVIYCVPSPTRIHTHVHMHMHAPLHMGREGREGREGGLSNTLISTCIKHHHYLLQYLKEVHVLNVIEESVFPPLHHPSSLPLLPTQPSLSTNLSSTDRHRHHHHHLYHHHCRLTPHSPPCVIMTLIMPTDASSL
jgi:hypothetical protein